MKRVDPQTATMRGIPDSRLAASSRSSGVKGWGCDTVPPAGRQEVSIRSRRHLRGANPARTSASPRPSSRSGSGVKGRGGEGAASRAPIRRTPVRDQRTRSAAGLVVCRTALDAMGGAKVASLPARTAIRDSKSPTRGPLTVPAPVFAAFVDALKRTGGPV
ncbi:DUF397 domain-containing protein [Streptomyces althioticus]|uniref:DUF397 domain-containing protein n=1 Tax=Streptomyces althioticus TaxID=83380 RepID=UPI003797178A